MSERIITIDDRNRIVVDQDMEGGECPVSWDPEGAGILTVSAERGYSHLRDGFGVDELEHAVSLAQEHHPDKNRVEVALLHLRRQGLTASFRTLRGYSQSDWMEVLIWTRGEGYHEGLIDQVGQWFRGDVFIVSHETLESYVHTANDARTLDRWERRDSVGGVYFDDNTDEAILALADEHFTLPERSANR